ncbi:MAG TPA: DUF5908 family protein [Bacteroidales bacterium]|nr:DUF5908 family protein [Bacteroidales bacterium]
MSIEIKELAVKFNVTAKNGQSNTDNKVILSQANYKKIVKECTEKVLKELEQKFER